MLRCTDDVNLISGSFGSWVSVNGSTEPDWTIDVDFARYQSVVGVRVQRWLVERRIWRKRIARSDFIGWAAINGRESRDDTWCWWSCCCCCLPTTFRVGRLRSRIRWYCSAAFLTNCILGNRCSTSIRFLCLGFLGLLAVWARRINTAQTNPSYYYPVAFGFVSQPRRSLRNRVQFPPDSVSLRVQEIRRHCNRSSRFPSRDGHARANTHSHTHTRTLVDKPTASTRRLASRILASDCRWLTSALAADQSTTAPIVKKTAETNNRHGVATTTTTTTTTLLSERTVVASARADRQGTNDKRRAPSCPIHRLQPSRAEPGRAEPSPFGLVRERAIQLFINSVLAIPPTADATERPVSGRPSTHRCYCCLCVYVCVRVCVCASIAETRLHDVSADSIGMRAAGIECKRSRVRRPATICRRRNVEKERRRKEHGMATHPSLPKMINPSLWCGPAHCGAADVGYSHTAPLRENQLRRTRWPVNCADRLEQNTFTLASISFFTAHLRLEGRPLRRAGSVSADSAVRRIVFPDLSRPRSYLILDKLWRWPGFSPLAKRAWKLFLPVDRLSYQLTITTVEWKEGKNLTCVKKNQCGLPACKWRQSGSQRAHCLFSSH